MSSNVALIDFVNTVPLPVTAALIQYAPLISVVRYTLQVVHWKRSWYDAGLVIVFWWAICLLADVALRYLLPILVALLAVVISAPARQPSTPLATEKTLQNTVIDLTTIGTLLPSKPFSPLPRTLPHIVGVVYIPYLLATHLVPLRILLGVTGTSLLVAQAPFVGVVISTLSRSAWLRWSFWYLSSWITHHPLPPIVLSRQPTPTNTASAPSFRFLFTIYENQRWWMGLDWTAALLPNERPSWCTPEPVLQPVSPPNTFTLPSPTSVYLKDGIGRRIKRTASWGWEEREWKVTVRREGAGYCRVERPVPEDVQNTTGGSKTAGSILLKAAGKMRDSSVVGGGAVDGHGNSDAQENGYGEEEDLRTDGDGWVYGDNKWEGLSSKGGIGKYTRFRRWTRVAVVSEVVELVEDGPLGMDFPEKRASSSSDERVYAMGTLTTRPDDESPLRQRLRRALSKTVNLNE